MRTGTEDRTELTDADRAALQSSLDEYLMESEGPGELASPQPLPFTDKPPRLSETEFRASAVVIDFRRAKLHFDAARSMDAAAPGAPMRTAETLRALAEDFRGRARGAPPVRG